MEWHVFTRMLMHMESLPPTLSASFNSCLPRVLVRHKAPITRFQFRWHGGEGSYNNGDFPQNDIQLIVRTNGRNGEGRSYTEMEYPCQCVEFPVNHRGYMQLQDVDFVGLKALHSCVPITPEVS